MKKVDSKLDTSYMPSGIRWQEKATTSFETFKTAHAYIGVQPTLARPTGSNPGFQYWNLGHGFKFNPGSNDFLFWNIFFSKSLSITKKNTIIIQNKTFQLNLVTSLVEKSNSRPYHVTTLSPCCFISFRISYHCLKDWDCNSNNVKLKPTPCPILVPYIYWAGIVTRHI